MHVTSSPVVIQHTKGEMPDVLKSQLHKIIQGSRTVSAQDKLTFHNVLTTLRGVTSVPLLQHNHKAKMNQ